CHRVFYHTLSSCDHAHPDLPSFPTRRSSDLQPGFGADLVEQAVDVPFVLDGDARQEQPGGAATSHLYAVPAQGRHGVQVARGGEIEEHTSELQSLAYLVCRLLLEKKNSNKQE